MGIPDWRQIVTEHGPAVWKTARRLLGNDADAADCFQDALVSVLEVSRRERVRNWSGLLQRLVTQRAFDRLRERIRRSRRHEASDGWNDVAASDPSPLGQVQAAELADSLRRALAELPAQQAEVFSLREFSDLSYGEIADALGITSNAAGVLLHRARARLAELLESYRPGEQARCADA